MNRKERLEIVRRYWWNNRQMPLTEIAKMSGVSLRTTYRDVHSVLSRTMNFGDTLLARQ